REKHKPAISGKSNHHHPGISSLAANRDNFQPVIASARAGRSIVVKVLMPKIRTTRRGNTGDRNKVHPISRSLQQKLAAIPLGGRLPGEEDIPRLRLSRERYEVDRKSRIAGVDRSPVIAIGEIRDSKRRPVHLRVAAGACIDAGYPGSSG